MNSSRYLNKQDRFFFGIVIVITFLFYSRSLGYDFFVIDDLEFIKNNFRVTNPSFNNVLWYWQDANTKTPFYFNFIQLISAFWSNQNAAIYRFTNILAHAINSFLVYKLSLSIIPRFFSEKFSQDGVVFKWAAFFSALVFIIHPAQVESVVWVFSQRGVLATMGALLSLIFYLKFIDEKSKKYLVLSLVFYIAGMLFKYSIAALPIAFVLFDYYFVKDMTIQKSLAKNWAVVSFGAIFFFLFSYEYSADFQKYLKISLMDSVFISLRCMGHYFSRLFYPFDYALDFGLNYFNFKDFRPHIWLSRILMVFSMLLTGYSVMSLIGEKKNYLIFCFMLLLASLFTGLGFIPHVFQYSSFVADRYMYLGVFPFGLFLSFLSIELFRRSQKISFSIGALLTIAYSIACVGLINLWASNGELLQQSHLKKPNSSIVKESMITYYQLQNDFEPIEGQLRFELEQKKTIVSTYDNFARHLGRKQKIRDGLILIEYWKRSRKEYAEVLAFYMFIEAKMYSYARTQLDIIKAFPKNIIVENKIEIKSLEDELLSLKKEMPLIFSAWEQHTREKYSPLSAVLGKVVEIKEYK
jgi:hypothetical protein